MEIWISVFRLLVFTCWLFIQKSKVSCEAFEDLVENWPWLNPTAPRLEQVMAGKDITLRCAGRVENATAFWDYKACGSLLGISCIEAISNEREGTSEDWFQLPSRKNSISLTNVRHTDSGLYRCMEAASNLINVFSTIQLEVISYSEEQDLEIPQFLDGLPKNHTVKSKTQEIFQCKVSSRSQPMIVWLFEAKGPIQYEGQFYLPRNSSGMMKLSDNVYLSKMVIQHVQYKHAGRYYCIAVNTKGFANASMLLNVISNDDDLDFENLSQGTSLYYLFLIPVALALFPLSIWLCFLCLRRNIYTPSYAAKQEDGLGDVTYAFGNDKPENGYCKVSTQPKNSVDV